MKSPIYILVLTFIFYFCSATIPPQSVTLTDAISKEGKRMHQLNLALLNKMFKDKRESIDTFIKNDYTETYLDEFRSKIPKGTNLDAELSGILKAAMKEINSQRDMMQSALENQRIKLLTKLETDYKAYEEATVNLRRLLESAVKLDEENKRLYSQVSELSGNRIDLNKIENSIDEFIFDAGDVSQRILKLNESIDSIIN